MACAAVGKRIVGVGEGEGTDDLGRDLVGILTAACGRRRWWDASDPGLPLRAGPQPGAAREPGPARGGARFASNWGLERCLQALARGDNKARLTGSIRATSRLPPSTMGRRWRPSPSRMRSKSSWPNWRSGSGGRSGGCPASHGGRSRTPTVRARSAASSRRMGSATGSACSAFTGGGTSSMTSRTGSPQPGALGFGVFNSDFPACPTARASAAAKRAKRSAASACWAAPLKFTHAPVRLSDMPSLRRNKRCQCHRRYWMG